MELLRFRFNGRKLKASGLLEINPKNLKLGSPLFFRVSNQPPKEDLEVKSGYNHNFTYVSTKPFEGSIKLRIDWVAWDSKVVLLTRRYETNEKRLYEQLKLKNYCSFEEFANKIEKLKELPEDWTPSTSDLEKHPINFIESLMYRLNVVEELESKKLFWFPQLSNSGLALFIICTCIESLGSEHFFMSYIDWIKSKKTEKEVNAIFKKVSNKTSPKELLVRVFEEYNKHHGNNRAYRTFFDSLGKNWKSKLEKTFYFTRNDPPTFKMKESHSIKKLLDFLLDFRNSFAHRFESIFSLPTPMEWKMFRDKFESINQETYNQTSFITYQRVLPSGAFETITTRNLLGTLTQAVKYSLWNWICKQSDKTQ